MKSTSFFSLSARGSGNADDEESQHLMEEVNDYSLPFSSLASHLEKTLIYKRVYIFIIHAALVLLVGLLLHYHHDSLNVMPLKGRTWSPVHPFIEYEVNGQRATDHHYSQFSGPPTPEQDDAWVSLTKPTGFNATLEELDKAGESLEDLARLKDGGYPASLGVYHQLHCLRQIRLYIYRNKYYPNLTEDQDANLIAHIDHCTEALRLAVMCHGDTHVYSYSWGESAYKPDARSSSKSICVKWSSIEDWALANMVHAESILRPEEYSESLS
ncbi:uncharacterized protein F4807DRAFT_451197 [Annulohypoxylon truncatum]|uniref:uncharacterized protein n=1 Tax=Annulohypoxylon truncatum TaxID=327061 RepID=UPI002007A57B|nr:uncharacterized protein F4807DRAFT_451197 [Annulohypoxylon truncatum]KAI1211099.1 hypothetical protein F4807DRAFT_451197 [Annulohypoxylon truncatum]